MTGRVTVLDFNCCLVPFHDGELCMNEIRTGYLQILIPSHAPTPLYDLSRFSFLRNFLLFITPTITHSIIRTSDNRPPTIDFHDETSQR